jgi:type II secretion system protein G
MVFSKGYSMNRRKGFTLIELLIVILILGALAAIAIPRITQSADNAKKNACATNVDLINSQIEMYAANNSGTYPATLQTVTRSTTYFPDGEPNCPFGTPYVMTNNRVVSHTH